jgi:hypothetical protein
MQIQNNSATQCSWDVIVRSNLVYANRIGLFLVSNTSMSSQLRVLSMGNIYRQNQVGVNIHGGRDAFAVVSSPAGSTGCSVNLTSQSDRIVDNVGASNIGGLGGGVVAIAGLRTNAGAGPSSGNTLELHFLETQWLGNLQGTSRRDLQVFGAFSVGGPPGTDDAARVLIRRGTSDGSADAFAFTDSQPPDPTGTDLVTIVGSDVALMNTNVGIP